MGGGILTSCSNSSGGGGGKGDREITEQYENEYLELLLTFYDDGTFEFKNDKGYVSKGTYTKSGNTITGTLTSGEYKGWEFEVDTSTGNVKMNGSVMPGFGEVTTPSNPDEPDKGDNQDDSSDSEIDAPDYLVLKGTVISGFIESKLPENGAVEIPEGVTGIDPYSQIFYMKKTIKSVTIPGTLTTISKQAFQNCSNLETVKIGDGVQVIGEYAFSNCTSLKSVNIPSSVTTIGSFAFSGCSALDVEITIPKGVTEISDNAFASCELTAVSIPDTVTEIGVQAFRGCGFTEVTIPASVTKIGKNAFAYCSDLESVIFKDQEGWYHNSGTVLFEQVESEKIDVSDHENNAQELKTSENKWCGLGIYKETN